MPHDDLPRRALLADLTSRLAVLSTGDARIAERFLSVLEGRPPDGTDLDERAQMLVVDLRAEQAAVERERGERRGPSAEIRIDNQGRRRVVARYPDLSRTLSADDLQAVAKARADRERRTADVQIGRPGDNWGGDPIVVDDPVAEFADDQHRTKLSEVPARLAAAELERGPDERWPDYESVDLRFDDSDAEEPLGVHAPGGDLGGEDR